MRNRQAEIIRHMSNSQLFYHLILSQLLLLVIAVILAWLLLDEPWRHLFYWDPLQLFLYGVIPGILVVFIDLLMMKYFPEKWYDDGGINKRLFKGQSTPAIVVICLLVAISEELLFRGIIQTVFGYVLASIVFALVHIRYLFKPVLFISVFLLSFYIGYLYEVTNNLLVTIIAHFIIDLLLALVFRKGAI